MQAGSWLIQVKCQFVVLTEDLLRHGGIQAISHAVLHCYLSSDMPADHANEITLTCTGFVTDRVSITGPRM